MQIHEQVAAFLLDHKNFAGVPHTTLVRQTFLLVQRVDETGVMVVEVDLC